MKRAVLCACVLLVGVVTSCGEDRNDAGGSGTPHGAPPPGGVAINGTVREWRVTIDLGTVHAGPVKFTTANLGTITHEFVVIHTDIPDGEIPLAGNKFNEEAPGVDSPGEISEFEVGKVGETVINLEPGHYQLVCNLPGHYHNGMHVPLLVLA